MNPAEFEARRVRALLDARSAALARRGHADRREGVRLGFLVCALGAERCGLPVAAVAGVLPGRPCTPVPGASPALRGIIAHAGAVVSVIDLALALGLAPGRDGGSHLVLLRRHGPPVALAVDRALDLAQVEADAVALAPEAGATPAGLGSDAISGYAHPAASGLDAQAAPVGKGTTGTGGFSVIDLPRLLRPFLP